MCEPSVKVHTTGLTNHMMLGFKQQVLNLKVAQKTKCATSPCAIQQSLSTKEIGDGLKHPHAYK